jgi:hypothetical protein
MKFMSTCDENIPTDILNVAQQDQLQEFVLDEYKIGWILLDWAYKSSWELSTTCIYILYYYIKEMFFMKARRRMGTKIDTAKHS